MSDIKTDAKTIVNVLLETDTEDRGNLLHEVGNQLRDETQYFTAGVIQRAAELYGYNHE